MLRLKHRKKDRNEHRHQGDRGMTIFEPHNLPFAVALAVMLALLKKNQSLMLYLKQLEVLN